MFSTTAPEWEESTVVVLRWQFPRRQASLLMLVRLPRLLGRYRSGEIILSDHPLWVPYFRETDLGDSTIWVLKISVSNIPIVFRSFSEGGGGVRMIFLISSRRLLDGNIEVTIVSILTDPIERLKLSWYPRNLYKVMLGSLKFALISTIIQPFCE